MQKTTTEKRSKGLTSSDKNVVDKERSYSPTSVGKKGSRVPVSSPKSGTVK